MTKLEEVLQQINEYGIADEVKSAILAQEDNKNTKKKNKWKIHTIDRNTETAISTILYKNPITPIGYYNVVSNCPVLEKNTGTENKSSTYIFVGYWGASNHYAGMYFQPFFYL